ncbi:MAG TPA: DUF1553 domain-containing protein [Verrucomicrobiae bacterium]|nr:DUF1553 domain-containing protein [Verrucomicrobiae bacterium]
MLARKNHFVATPQTSALRSGAWAVVLTQFVLAVTTMAATPPIDFAQEIRPVFERRCHECHGPEKQKHGFRLDRRADALRGGDSGEAAIVPGHATDSPLIKRVTSSNRDEQMPPKGERLDPAQIEKLRQWIDQGAVWPETARTNAKPPAFWTFQPIQHPAPPAVKNTRWARTTIDRFVLAKLEAKGLVPAPPASKEVWLRRATFDLHGLAPTPAEIDAFLADHSPQAYDRVIERLLASPRYGERWARHWLDLARFGESDGFEYDHMRPNAWPYRDYVIGSLNADKPYAQFVREQLAGDVIAQPTRESIAATGFLTGGPYDAAGNTSPSESLKLRIREEEMEDVVSATAQTFLGLTVNCARCHNHKFDSIPQEDYYRIKAALDGVRHGERSWLTPEEARQRKAQLDALDRKTEEATQKITALEALGRDRVLEAKQKAVKSASDAVQAPAPVARWTFEKDTHDAVGAAHGTLEGGAKIANGRLVLDGKTAYFRAEPLGQELRAKTLEAWVTLPDLAQRGGGVISVETASGGTFDALVFGEREAGRWMAGSEFFRRTRDLNAPVESAKPGELIHVAVVYQTDGTMQVFRQGQPYGESYKPAGEESGPRRFAPDETRVLLGLRHTAAGNGFLKAEIEEARLYDRALSAAEIRASAQSLGGPVITSEEAFAALTPDQRRQVDDLRRELDTTKAARKGLEAEPKVYAAISKAPGPTFILGRGEIDKRRGEATAGALSAVTALPCDFGLAANSPEGERRLRLADWITDSRNPLTARVLVNRVWQHHFGRGLVATPSDFGVNGERPTHPELLDWLASEFLARGGRLKDLHRLVMTSAAYRQSGSPTAGRKPAALEKGRAVDPEDRLLWHYPGHRLEAEAVRDTLLQLAGRLDDRSGGPGFQPFKVTISGSSFYELVENDDPAFNRRSIYRMGILSGKDPLLESFDCPDPSTKTPARGLTTTPIQALGLMNTALVQRSAKQMADRLVTEAGPKLGDQIRRGYRLALGRLPRAQELAEAEAHARAHGMASLCWALLNCSEFIYVE